MRLLWQCVVGSNSSRHALFLVTVTVSAEVTVLDPLWEGWPAACTLLCPADFNVHDHHRYDRGLLRRGTIRRMGPF